MPRATALAIFLNEDTLRVVRSDSDLQRSLVTLVTTWRARRGAGSSAAGSTRRAEEARLGLAAQRSAAQPRLRPARSDTLALAER
jgi:hypothetical protein